MSELAQFLVQCAASGALIKSLCALIIIPATAWAACRAFAPSIVRMRDDPAWQAPLAAAAASIPGALFVTLAGSALIMGAYTACLTLPAGRAIFALIGAASVAAIARATYCAIQRVCAVHRLVAGSQAAEPRLSAAASAAGVRARQLQDYLPLCAVAGVVRPSILVSTGALERLDDDELRAALLHEAAHVRRADQLLAAVISFFVDLPPLPASDLVAAYRAAREIAADQRAVHSTAPEHLAGALVAFAKGARPVAATAGLTGFGEARGRIAALLSEPAIARPNWVRRCVVTLALAAIFALGIASPSLAAGRHTPCAEAHAQLKF